MPQLQNTIGTQHALVSQPTGTGTVRLPTSAHGAKTVPQPVGAQPTTSHKRTGDGVGTMKPSNNNFKFKHANNDHAQAAFLSNRDELEKAVQNRSIRHNPMQPARTPFDK